jgi:hypothetical protein
MAIRTIVSLPDPVLRRRARPISAFGKELQSLIDDMIETMRGAPGVGLAAPQVSVSERVIVVEYGEEEEAEDGEVIEKPKKLYVMINPEIVKASEETVWWAKSSVFRRCKSRGSIARDGQPGSKRRAGWRVFSSMRSIISMACSSRTAPRRSGNQKRSQPKSRKFNIILRSSTLGDKGALCTSNTSR